MSTISIPKQINGPAPVLTTLHEIELILRDAAAKDAGPLSLAEIKRRMQAKSVRHATVRTCIDELKRLHLATEDEKRGVMWTLHEDPKFWRKKGLIKL